GVAKPPYGLRRAHRLRRVIEGDLVEQVVPADPASGSVQNLGLVADGALGRVQIAAVGGDTRPLGHRQIKAIDADLSHRQLDTPPTRKAATLGWAPPRVNGPASGATEGRKRCGNALG